MVAGLGILRRILGRTVVEHSVVGSVDTNVLFLESESFPP